MCLVMITSTAFPYLQSSATEQKVVVVSVSPQSRASLAARFDLSSGEAGRRLTSFFKGLGECKCSFYSWRVDLDKHGHFC